MVTIKSWKIKQLLNLIDLMMHSRHLHDLNRLSNYCKKRGIKVINITNGGLLDMFPRESVLPVFESK